MFNRYNIFYDVMGWDSRTRVIMRRDIRKSYAIVMAVLCYRALSSLRAVVMNL